jgi:hypothetical protein
MAGDEMNNELLQQVARDVTKLLVAVMGNGTKGLAQRVDEMEEWMKDHPRVCPLEAHIEETVNTPKERKTSWWTVFASVFGAIGVIGSLLVAIVK